MVNLHKDTVNLQLGTVNLQLAMDNNHHQLVDMVCHHQDMGNHQ
jgi:hypothetical protein